MNKEDVWGVCVYNGVLLNHKKRNSAIYSNMDEPKEHYVQWSKSDKERQILYDTTSMRYLKNNTNEYICKTETDTENKVVVTKEKGEGKGQIGGTELIQITMYKI